MLNIILLSMLCILVAAVCSPLLIRIVKKTNLLDRPNVRKMHISPMPTFGGLAIFAGFLFGILLLQPDSKYHIPILIGAVLIIILGVMDDKYQFTPKVKWIGEIVAALIVVVGGGLQVEFINLPFGGQLEFGFFSVLITVLWILGITNAINFIDGLDGLAAGISAIALLSIAVMAIVMGNVYVLTMSMILFWSIIGFLPFNFHPAKVFMGDTGALFLGYMISVLSLLGFKNVAFVSFIVPIFILAVPIIDTFVAIIRRVVQKRPISSPDSSHFHHKLVSFGMSHKQTVLFMYGLSAMFSMAAILLSMSTIWGTVLIAGVVLVVIQILIESLELIDSTYKPLTNLMTRRRREDR